MKTHITTVDDRPTIVLERELDSSLERVWRAITDPAELDRWFVAPVPWTPTLGERFEAEGQHGEVTELDPPHTLAWSWGNERYRITLAPTAAGCTLTFLHTFDTT